MQTEGKESFSPMDDHGRRALEEIYEEFFPRIYNYIYYRLLHREETEDLVSRIFLKVAEHLHEYDPKKAKLDTWIFRIAERTLIDHFRTRKNQLSLEDENAGLENRFRVEFEEEYERILEPGRRAVFAALSRMKERDRMAVYYVCFLEMSYREAAARLGIGESTLASALMRAKRKLRAYLEESGDVV